MLLNNCTLNYDYLIICTGLSLKPRPRNIPCAPLLDSDAYEHPLKPLPILSSSVIVVVGSGTIFFVRTNFFFFSVGITALSTVGHAHHHHPKNKIVLVTKASEFSIEYVVLILNKYLFFFAGHVPWASS